MHITIQEKKENVLLHRREIKGTLNYEQSTPSNKELAEVLAKELHIEEKLIVIKHIYNKFSHKEAKFLAVAYDKEEIKTKTERINSHLRKKLEEQAKKVAA